MNRRQVAALLLRRLAGWWCSPRTLRCLGASLVLNLVYLTWAPARTVLPPPDYLSQLLGN